MANSKINLERLLNPQSFPDKLNLFTIDNVKEIMNLNSTERKKTVDEFWDEEDIEDLSRYDYSPDSTMLIQFAVEEHCIKIENLSKKTKIQIDILKDLIKGKLMPWKLKAEEVLTLINILDIPCDDFIKGIVNKKITVSLKQLKISGMHLPRAKNLSQKEQKKAMIEMERQIAIQDEEEERDIFIQELKNLVNR
ncbi:hypothetical protein BTO30_15580 [Domibacillus antri]|uniref:Uncharacterized protein n=1 Tax=Domibacillus antri TaxID=1714264 RepID=A0A1Q8Q1X4_9BACI|nr:hypothetical protein [Domibacillus antri]OLN21330.1 hypothetical protein BTO30_15580 [Domibacillus antri]